MQFTYVVSSLQYVVFSVQGVVFSYLFQFEVCSVQYKIYSLLCEVFAVWSMAYEHTTAYYVQYLVLGFGVQYKVCKFSIKCTLPGVQSTIQYTVCSVPAVG